MENKSKGQLQNEILNLKKRLKELEKAKKKLSASETYFSTLFKNLTDIIFEIDYQGKYISVAPTSPDLVIKPPKELIGKKLHEVFSKQMADNFLNYIQDSIDNKKTNKFEYFLEINKKGYWFKVTVNPLSKNSALFTAHDVSESKGKEEIQKKLTEEFTSMLNNLNGFLYRCSNDKNWTMKFISAGCYQLTGYKPEDLINSKKISFNDLILPKFQEYLWKEWQKRLKTKQPVEVEYQIKTASGEIKWVWERGRGVYDNNGELIHLEGFITEISKLKKTEAALKDSIEQFKFLTDSTIEGVLVHDNGVVLDSNEAFLKMTGFTKEEAVGKSVFDYIPDPLDRAKVIMNMKNQKLKPYTITARRQDGSTFLAELEGKIVHKGDKKLTIVAVRNVTERVNAQKKLQESENRFRNLLNSSPISIWEEDFSEVYRYIQTLKKKGITEINAFLEKDPREVKICSEKVKILDVNNTTLTMFKAKSKDQLITNLDTIFTKDSLNKFKDQVVAIAANKTFFKGTCINRTFDGRNLTVSLQWVVLPGYEKDYSRVITSLMDVTEAEIASKKLEKSEKKYRSLVEQLNEGIAITDENECFTFVNQATADIFGYKKNKLIGMGLNNLTDKENYQKILEKQRDRKAGKSGNYNLQIIRKDGNFATVEVNVNPIFDEKGKFKGSIGVITDITENLKNHKIQQALYNISNAVNTIDDMMEFYEMIRDSLGLIIDTTNFYIALYNESNDSITLPYNVDQIDSFETFPAGKTLTAYLIKQKRPLLVTAEEQERLQKAGIIEQIGSSSEIWLGVPLKVEDKVVGAMVVQSYQDKNAYSEADVEMLEFVANQISTLIVKKNAQEDLKLIKKHLETATSILRHDITNDLAVIKSGIRLYQNQGKKELLDEVNKRITKGLDMIKRHKTYESFIEEHTSLEEYEIAAVIDSVITNYPNLEFAITGSSKVYADSAIYSVCDNIINNAVKHGNATKIDIEISSNEHNCEIKFIDNGQGISDKIKDKIFEKGYYYGKAGHTGIGLYIVKQTVVDYGGEVSVEDNETGGVTFVVKLRRVEVII
ncbi:MAG: PAS domain S-box protein [Candidatus Cloacimonetes bacterium]|nr:PAS domain S-box protein [Candidatus Cloacimonadota bacterium]